MILYGICSFVVILVASAAFTCWPVRSPVTDNRSEKICTRYVNDDYESYQKPINNVDHFTPRVCLDIVHISVD